MSRASTQQDSSGSGDEDWAPSAQADSPDGASSEGVRRCKVDGCGLDLTHHKTFFRRARCCPTHARELTVHLDGQGKRLCQQCSTFHLLADFDGTKRSCRTRLESHKIRQREHNNRRMAQAAAALQQKAAAAAGATAGSPLPAAAQGVQVPAAGNGQEQQMRSAGEQMGVFAPWATLQQPAQWQQAQQMMHQEALQTDLHSMAAQQQQQQGDVGMCDAPSIFADVPLDKLPVDMHPNSQPSWDDDSPADVYNLSGFWDGPPPQDRQAFDAGIMGCDARTPSIGDMDLRQPLPLVELLGSTGLTPSFVRSMSADAGAACLAGWEAVSGLEKGPSRLGSAGRRDSQRSSASQLLSLGSDPLAVETRSDSAFEPLQGRRHRSSLPLQSPFQWPVDAPPPHVQRRVDAAAPGGRAALKRSAPQEPPGVECLRTHSVKRSSLNSYDPPSRETFTTAKRASLGFLRSDSASEGCGRFSQVAACRGQLEDLRRRALLDGRASGACSPCGSLHSADSDAGPVRSLVRRSTMRNFSRSSAPLPSRHSPKRRSMDVLLDAAPPHCGTHLEDRAFDEQAPEPLYLAAQLVRETGLPRRQLPEFSYGADRSAGASPGPSLHAADKFEALRGCSPEPGVVDEIGGAALQALLRSEGAAALEEVSERLRWLACSLGRASPPVGPPAAGRRIRRRSCNGGAARRGLLSLVA